MAVFVFPVGAYLLNLEQAAPSGVRPCELPTHNSQFCTTTIGTLGGKVKACQKGVICKAAFVTYSSRFVQLYSLICETNMKRNCEKMSIPALFVTVCGKTR
ncbi:hypothetical protein AMECASPLE_037232 [Ameca splendens]|uniref:Uncharacterized protein n=1 Tax=Ameca splendens TaxID=208324 RepID=A0ABV0Z685_9TELE